MIRAIQIGATYILDGKRVRVASRTPKSFGRPSMVKWERLDIFGKEIVETGSLPAAKFRERAS